MGRVGYWRAICIACIWLVGIDSLQQLLASPLPGSISALSWCDMTADLNSLLWRARQ